MSKTKARDEAGLIVKLVSQGVDKRTAKAMAQDMVQTQERMVQQGFDPERTFYHATKNPDFNEVDLEKSQDIGFHMGGSPEQANSRLSDVNTDYNLGKRNSAESYVPGDYVMPLRAALGKSLELPDIRWADPNEILSRLERMPEFQADVKGLYFPKTQWKEGLAKVRKIIKDKGYNSIKYRNEIEGSVVNNLTPEGKALKRQLDSEMLTIRQRAQRRPDRSYTPEEQQRFTQIMGELKSIRENPKFSEDPYSYIALEPEKVRSVNAKFKDPTSRNLMKSIAGLGAVITLGSQSEDAEASPAVLQKLAREYIKQGVAPDMAEVVAKRAMERGDTSGVLRKGDIGIDPRYAAPSKAKDAVSKLEGLTTKRELDSAVDIPEVSIVDFEGRPFVTSMSDRSDAGRTLTEIKGVKLKRPVSMPGGQDYMFHNPAQWASATGAVKGMMNLGREAQKKAGTKEAPLHFPWRMAPTGNDFAPMVGETMLSFAETNMDKAQKNAFNTAIRTLVPDWKGVDDANMIAQYRALSDKQRKALKDVMDKFKEDGGGLSIGEARLAVSAPDQVNARWGGLQNVGEIDLNAPMTPEPNNPAYPTRLPGQGIGRLKEDIPVYGLDPETIEVMRGNNPKRVIDDFMNPTPSDLRSIMASGGGVITDKVLKGLQSRGVIPASAVTAGMLSMTPSEKVLAQGVEPKPTAGGSIVDYVKNLPEVLMQSGEDIARTTLGALRGVVDPKAGVDIMTDPNRAYTPSEEGSAAYNRLNDAFGNVAGAVMDQPFFGAFGGPKTGEVVGQGVEAYGNLPEGVRDVTDRGLMAALAASQILPMKGDFRRNAVAQKTQRGNTVGTAVKANDYLDSIGVPKDSVLDYGAGLGENAKAIGATHTFEPFPQKGFEPDFTDPAQVPAQSFSRVVSTNVLNVLPKDLRTEAVLNIGKSLKPGGTALVQTWDLGAIKTTSKSKTAKPAGEENAYITGTGTFQKGFSAPELQQYVQETLGDLYTVEIVPNKAKLSGVAVTITRN